MVDLVAKEGYRASEIAEVLGIEESRIRFYEAQFRQFLSPKSLQNQYKLFPPSDLRIFQTVNILVEDEHLSIQQVKRRLVAQAEPEVSPRARYGHVLTVTSGKGGVGKTNVAINLGIEFSRLGMKVAVMDADLGLANVHLLSGVSPRYSLADVMRGSKDMQGIIEQGPEGVQIVSGGSGIFELANLGKAQRDYILQQLEVLENGFDVLLVDTAGGISETVLDFVCFADQVIVVTTPEFPAIADAYGMIKVTFQKNPNSRIGLLVNRAESALEARSVFTRLSRCVKQFLDKPVAETGFILDDPVVSYATQRRIPYSISYPASRARRTTRRVAHSIAEESFGAGAEKKESFFSAFLGLTGRSPDKVGV